MNLQQTGIVKYGEKKVGDYTIKCSANYNMDGKALSCQAYAFDKNERRVCFATWSANGRESINFEQSIDANAKMDILNEIESTFASL